jgi:hypothetical protein
MKPIIIFCYIYYLLSYYYILNMQYIICRKRFFGQFDLQANFNIKHSRWVYEGDTAKRRLRNT